MPRLRAWLAATFGALALLFALAWPAAAERRVALVIGNSSYKNVVALSNPRNDAEDVANKLRDLGFEVMTRTNVEKANIRTVLRDFSRLMGRADVALVYFAGHALQYQNRSYMMPVDASLEDEFSVKFDMLSEDDVRSVLNQTDGVRIMIFDGCRNDPFQPKPGQATQTVAPVDVSGTVTVYATSPFELAEDGKARNSPFTRALLKQLAEPGLDITQIFRRVARDVRDQTQGRQKPEILVALDKPFVINQSASDRTAWAKIRHSSDPSDFRDFISRFPASGFVPDARFRLDVLTRQGRAIEEARRQEEERQKAVALAKAQEEDRRRREEALRRACEQEAASVASLAGNRNKAELARLKANAQCPDTVGRVDFVLAEIATAEAQARAEACRREGQQIEAAQQAGRSEDLQALVASAQCPETPARLQTALAAIAAARAEAQRKADAEARAREIAEACRREAGVIESAVANQRRVDLQTLRGQVKCPDTPARIEAALAAIATAEAEAKARAEADAKAQADAQRQRELVEACAREAGAINQASAALRRADLQAIKAQAKCPDTPGRVDEALAFVTRQEAEAKARADEQRQREFAEACTREAAQIETATQAGRRADLQALRDSARCPDTPSRVASALARVAAAEAEQRARQEADAKARAEEQRQREIAEACTRESALIAQVQGQGTAGRATLLALRDQGRCPETPARVTAALSALATAEAEAKALAEAEARTREQAARCQADLDAVEAAVRNRSRSAIQALRGRSTCPEVGARIDVALADIEAAETAEKQALAQKCAAEARSIDAARDAGRRAELEGLRAGLQCAENGSRITAALAALEANDRAALARTCQAEGDKVAALETAGDVGGLDGLRGATLCPDTPRRIEAALQSVRTRQERVCTAELAAFEPIKTSEADLARFVATATCDLVKGRAISQLSSLQLARENCEQETAILERLRQSGTPAEIADFKREARCAPVINILVAMANVPTETPVGPTPPPVTVPPAVNTRLLVERAQKALTRVSCYDGDADGSFGPKTVSALERYLKAKDDDTTAPEVTEPFVARLEAEPERRVCPLVCDEGERIQNGRCVVVRPTTPPRTSNRPPQRDETPPRQQPRPSQQQPTRPAPQQVTPPRPATPPPAAPQQAQQPRPRIILGN